MTAFSFTALSQNSPKGMDSHFVIRLPKTQYQFHGLHLTTTPNSMRPKVGLVLSGGGSRGLAQIGVLKTLEKHHVPIDYIVGNSLGAVVGGLYASGYTTSQLESLALRTNWDEVLSFFEESKRREKFVGEKESDQTGFLVVRFDGLQPIIPSSVASGQGLTNYFLNLTLQSVYHPKPSFDDLKIPFRAVATDLFSGKRVILDHGSLAEAMRASVSVPLLYASLRKDSMALVDGGLLSNIPVDVAKSLGCDVVIAVNSSGVLRRENQMSKPWEVADQIMSIMMQSANQEQLKSADVVIAPELGGRIATDFSRVDSLIQLGELAAELQVDHISELIRERNTALQETPEKVLDNATIELRGDTLPEDMKQKILLEQRGRKLSTRLIERQVAQLMELGIYQDVYAEITEHASPAVVVYHTIANPRIIEINFVGNSLVSDELIASEINSLKGTILNYKNVQERLEAVINIYRNRRFSLVRIDAVDINPQAGVVNFTINEGIVDGLYFEGNRRTRDYVIRREFPLDKGNVFDFDEAYKGLANVYNTGLFESVLLDVRYREENEKPVLVLKVREKSAELLRLGLHADNERNVVTTFDVRDENFRGAGENLGVTFRFDFRDRILQAEYRANRIFQTYFTFNLKTYLSSRDYFNYSHDQSDTSHWDINEVGKYSEIKYGGSFTFGTQLQRLGDLTAAIRVEHHRITPLSGLTYGQTDYRFVGLKIQSTIDTENKFWFPTDGILMTLSFETALKGFGSEISYDKIGITYESYTTILRRHTLHPRITFGFADETLPTIEQFSLGGQESFFGLREDDSRGRQIFLVNMEYRYWLPFKFVFETYLKVRYDIGTISDKPQELTLNSFHHGIGAELSLDTPLGPASLGVGKSFFYRQDALNSPPNVGPLLFYFSFGHRL